VPFPVRLLPTVEEDDVTAPVLALPSRGAVPVLVVVTDVTAPVSTLMVGVEAPAGPWRLAACRATKTCTRGFSELDAAAVSWPPLPPLSWPADRVLGSPLSTVGDPVGDGVVAAVEVTAADDSAVQVTGTDVTGIDAAAVDASGTDVKAVDVTGTVVKGVDVTGTDMTAVVVTGTDVKPVNVSAGDVTGGGATGAGVTAEIATTSVDIARGDAAPDGPRAADAITGSGAIVDGPATDDVHCVGFERPTAAVGSPVAAAVTTGSLVAVPPSHP